jgi:hypothetical protein
MKANCGIASKMKLDLMTGTGKAAWIHDSADESEDNINLVLHTYLSGKIEVGRYHFARCS